MPLTVFLGGNDLEMETIRQMLKTQPNIEVIDRHLTWGAKASQYEHELASALRAGRTPVLVELEQDLPLSPGAVVIVDHHGERAGEEALTSLEQLFALVGKQPEEWTRWLSLVAANDRGHIDGLLAMGATREEILAVRRADRAAQGVSDDDERVAAMALANADHRSQGLVVVHLPHARTSPVTDMLHPALGGPGYECLAVVSPDEINVFADGVTVAALDSCFPGGWSGGRLPARGFWGIGGPTAEVLQFLTKRLSNMEPAR